MVGVGICMCYGLRIVAHVWSQKTVYGSLFHLYMGFMSWVHVVNLGFYPVSCLIGPVVYIVTNKFLMFRTRDLRNTQ